MALFDFFKKKTTNKDWGYDAEQIVQQLEILSYFKYASPTDIPEIKKEMVDSLSRFNYLGTVFFDQGFYHSKDFRHYPLDNEELFEEGGFTYYLQTMKILFDKMDFKLEISNHIEEDGEKGLNHFITLNGKEYIIFKNFSDAGWGEAAQRFAQIINDQLNLQNKEEKLYLISGGNDGHAVFLSDAQFALLDPILKGFERPFKVEDWCRHFQVDMKRYNQG
jgi:hypothetical protein